MTNKPILLNGDCLELMKQIPDNKIDMILCDLPYGTTACKWDTVIPFAPLWAEYKRIIKKNGAIVLFGSQPFTSALVMSNPDWFKHETVWCKNRSTAYAAAKYRPLQKHENILVFCEGVVTYNPQKTDGHKPTNSAKGCKQAVIYHGEDTWDYAGGNTTRYPTTLQYFDCERGLHPTQKPVPLGEYLIKTYSNEGEIVLDNCMGVGSFGIAAVNVGRRFIGMELDESYYEIARQMIEDATK